MAGTSVRRAPATHLQPPSRAAPPAAAEGPRLWEPPAWRPAGGRGLSVSAVSADPAAFQAPWGWGALGQGLPGPVLTPAPVSSVPSAQTQTGPAKDQRTAGGAAPPGATRWTATGASSVSPGPRWSGGHGGGLPSFPLAPASWSLGPGGRTGPLTLTRPPGWGTPGQPGSQGARPSRSAALPSPRRGQRDEERSFTVAAPGHRISRQPPRRPRILVRLI